MGRSTGFALDMGIRLASTRVANITLKLRSVFSHIMPEPGQAGPGSSPEWRRKSFCTFSYGSEMGFQIVESPISGFALADMGDG
jgi:hypothetical protein